MPTVEIRRRVDFPRGESGGGNDNDIAAAVALADADTADSGDCAICKGGQDGGGASKNHDAHCIRSVLLRCVWKRSMSVWNSFFCLQANLPFRCRATYSYNQSYILDLWY
jgi:hypothetical protein